PVPPVLLLRRCTSVTEARPIHVRPGAAGLRGRSTRVGAIVHLPCVTDLVAEGGPVAVDVVEVGAAVGGAAGGVDGGVQVGAAPPGGGGLGAGAGAAVGLLPRDARGADAVSEQTVGGGQRVDVGAQPRVDPRVAGEHVAGMGGEP